MDTDMVKVEKNAGGFIAPVADIESALARYKSFREFVSKVLAKGRDYGEIPGTDKPTLLKPGAEKLGTFFGLRPLFALQESVDDWTGKDHDGEPFFYRQYKCQLYRSGELIGESIGSCNSWEKKYRYRWISEAEIPASVDKSKLDYADGTISEFAFAIEKAETSGKYGKPAAYWKQFADAIANGTAKKIKRKTKKGDEMDAWEIGGKLYAVPNKDVADQVNTIDKMAQKRALVAAILIATNASDYFTQDMEDFQDHETFNETIIDGTFKEEDMKPKKAKLFTQDQINAVIAGMPNETLQEKHVVAMLSLSKKLDSETPVDLTVKWAKKYRQERNRDTKADRSLAADAADAELFG